MLARRGPLVNNLDASGAPLWGLCLRARSGERGNAQLHVCANVLRNPRERTYLCFIYLLIHLNLWTLHEDDEGYLMG